MQEEREKLVQEAEERASRMDAAHVTKEREWERRMDEARAVAQAQKDSFAKEREEHEALKNSRDEERKRTDELADSINTMRAKSLELHQENQKLDQILQGLGYATEMHSKGDEFL